MLTTMKCENDDSFDSNLRGKTNSWIQDHSPAAPIRTKATRKESKNGSKDPTRAKYYCRKCKAHDITVPVKKHKRICEYKDCICPRCKLVDEGREVVAKQISIYREQKSKGIDPITHGKLYAKQCVPFSAASILEKTADMACNVSSPHCRRCRNHYQVVTWKGHKKVCPYKICDCNQCTLINKRKDTEKNLRELTTHKEEGRHPMKQHDYNDYIHQASSKFVPTLGSGPGSGSGPIYHHNYNPPMATIGYYHGGTDDHTNLYNRLFNNSAQVTYSASGSSESPGLIDRISQSGTALVQPSALLAASQMANLSSSGQSAFSNTLKGFHSPPQTNYERSLSFANCPAPNPYPGCYSWNMNPPQDNNRLSANYQHNQTNYHSFSHLQFMTPSVTMNCERTLPNYSY